MTVPLPIGRVSVVVPVRDERASLEELLEGLRRVAAAEARPFEFVFVDDGSTDGSAEFLAAAAREDERVKLVRLRRSYGQTAALQAGFDASAGDVVVTLDGDGQHDPAEIPRFLRALEGGCDLVSGRRDGRPEAFLTRVLPSLAANWVIRRVSGVPLRDFGSTYKAYRRRVLEELDIQGGMHRFIPAVVGELGFRIEEIPIRCRPRSAGRSHYGLSRVFAVTIDVVVVKFLSSYLTRPSRVFGGLGLACAAPGLAIMGYTGLTFLRKVDPPIHHMVLIHFAVFLTLMGVQFLTFGLLAEMLSRVYLKTHRQRPYRLADGASGPVPPDGPPGPEPYARLGTKSPQKGGDAP